MMRKSESYVLEGFTIDLIHKLSEVLSFKYEIYTSPNNAYGSVKDGKWNGMIEQVRRGVSSNLNKT